MNPEKMGPVQPWWRIRIVWLAFGAPAAVVAASLVTLALAIHGRETQVSDAGAAESDSATPAVQARNHVSTPRR